MPPPRRALTSQPVSKMNKVWFILGLVVAVLGIATLKFLHLVTWLMVVAVLLVLVGYLLCKWVGRNNGRRNL